MDSKHEPSYALSHVSGVFKLATGKGTYAAASYLELRGAKSMLESARKRIVARPRSSSPEGICAFEAFTILTTAMLAVTRQLETL